MSEDEAIRVQLARMEGKQDVTNERLETANRINDERHAAIQIQLGTIDTRLNAHGERLTGIEKREHQRTGERQGLAISGRVVWAAVGFIPPAIVAAMKIVGL